MIQDNPSTFLGAAANKTRMIPGSVSYRTQYCLANVLNITGKEVMTNMAYKDR